MFLFLHTGFLQTFWKHLTHPGFTMNLNNGQQPLHNRLKAIKTLKHRSSLKSCNQLWTSLRVCADN